jgi:hypothetical protein
VDKVVIPPHGSIPLIVGLRFSDQYLKSLSDISEMIGGKIRFSVSRTPPSSTLPHSEDVDDDGDVDDYFFTESDVQYLPVQVTACASGMHTDIEELHFEECVSGMSYAKDFLVLEYPYYD